MASRSLTRDDCMVQKPFIKLRYSSPCTIHLLIGYPLRSYSKDRIPDYQVDDAKSQETSTSSTLNEVTIKPRRKYMWCSLLPRTFPWIKNIVPVRDVKSPRQARSRTWGLWDPVEEGGDNKRCMGIHVHPLSPLIYQHKKYKTGKRFSLWFFLIIHFFQQKNC